MRLMRHTLALLAALGAPVLLVVGIASAQESSATDLMAMANTSYERGEYAEATQQYEALVDQGYGDATLYFNLGSSYLESGDVGRAILYYLRARELSPRDMDIRDNLELARGMTVDGVAAERGSLVEGVSYFGHRWATPDELGIGAILLWVASGTAIGALIVWRAFPLRRTLRAATVLATAAATLLFLLVASMTYASPYDSTGVVTAAAVEVVSGPGPQYTGEFALHSGAQVRVADNRHGWVEIELPGGELQGWVPSHAIEIVGGGA